MRAVAYRWLVHWLSGYLGWDHTRPLPACIYHFIRTEFPSTNLQDIKVPDKDRILNSLFILIFIFIILLQTYNCKTFAYIKIYSFWA